MTGIVERLAPAVTRVSCPELPSLPSGSEWLEFLGDMAVRLDRIYLQAIPVVAIALREDMWPFLTEWNGHPIVRLAAGSPVRWGAVT